MVLPVLPSLDKKQKQIQQRGLTKLKAGGISIPFPELLVNGWMKDLVYLLDLTKDCLREYAEKSISMKGSKEGENLQAAGKSC